MINDMTVPGSIVLPAVCGKIGSWVYYAATMRMKDVVQRVRLAQEIHPSATLEELIQRQITKRSGEIADYLLSQNERFFNALVLGIYDGDPMWLDVALRDNPYLSPDSVPENVRHSLGYLQLTGYERIFALDGQHRVEGIRKAIVASPALGDEEVIAVFVAHRNDEDGLRRTRRLFTTLNRYAKPVSTLDKIALDEDDPSAIITRRLINDYPLFREGKIATTKEKSLPRTNTTAFTNVVTLYQVVDRVLNHAYGRRSPSWARVKRIRPSDEDLDSYYQIVSSVWDHMMLHIPVLAEIGEASPVVGLTLPYRSERGGHLLFRPVGLDVFFSAFVKLWGVSNDVGGVVSMLALMPMKLEAEPWIDILWSPAGTMITTPEAKRIATALLVIRAGGSLNARERTRLEKDLTVVGLSREKLQR